jgi:hypothetical protein
MNMSTMVRLLSLLVLMCLHGWAGAADNVAVAVFASDPQFKKYERAVQAKMEAILGDAGFNVLDEDKAKKMKEGWVDLADPGHLITAEEFMEKAGKYEVQKVYRVSFNAGVSNPLGLFFTATSSVQLRVIDRDAKVRSASSNPMGVKGFPPSDALTLDAALVNAVQRATDSAAEVSGLAVPIPTLARAVPLGLEPADAPAAPTALALATPSVASPAWPKAALLFDESFKKEEISCQAVSDDGQMGVVGGYTWQINRLRGLSRLYGARLHLVDIAGNKELTTFTLHELGQRGDGENGTSEPFACTFLGNWRYLVAMTGNKIACFDVERGLETCSIKYTNGPGKGKLSFWQADNQRYLRAQTDKGDSFYRIAVKK